ncbi:DUF802 domain-containing protein [Isoalcanivorax indicus]|uniref:DUF802 domain-containing protein n=1 Tax=Isoalcanivorax indicus TaxID=2202653 RepID=UPI000DB9ED83|nr:DUF802 domain-containing protein [Isoalcanivorax indicus]
MRIAPFALTCLAGALAILWIGFSFMNGNPAAPVIIVAIAVGYAVGVGELLGYRRDTRALGSALDRLPAPPEHLTPWLLELPAALRDTVRRRIDGDALPLPGPHLTPYLTGLLVMLGLLGTFVGMIITLQGAAMALDSSTELQAIQRALSAPIAGLSLAFGTSIAGVAGSAMLGLATVLCRRERVAVSRQLDRATGGPLRPFSAAARRDTAYDALTQQAQALPQLVATLQGMSEQMQRSNEQLTAQQRDAAAHTERQFNALAENVSHSLRTAVTDSSRVASEQLKPLLNDTLAGFAEQVHQQQKQLHDTAERHLNELAARFADTTLQAATQWQTGLEQQHQHNAALLAQMHTWLTDHQARTDQSATDLLEGHATGMQALRETLQQQLGALREQEAGHTQTMAQHFDALEARVATHLATLGTALEAPMTRLIETASETPKAAADVISRLREEIGHHAERDNALLEERQRIMTELDQLLHRQREATVAQQQAIDTLITHASRNLAEVNSQFAGQVETQRQQLDDLVTDVRSSAVDIASLGDAFGAGVGQFADANQQLLETLQQVQTALTDSATRSDEQLAYYVEQAREVIELSLSLRRDGSAA